jgi:hypothetical protein
MLISQKSRQKREHFQTVSIGPQGCQVLHIQIALTKSLFFIFLGVISRGNLEWNVPFQSVHVNSSVCQY